MASSTLINHKGARDVTLNELALIEAPPPTETWFPVSHFDVFRVVDKTLRSAGYEVRKQSFSITPDKHRFFGTLDLTSRITDGISLAVGIRNSTDQSFTIGMCCGNRVFVCDNLSFTSEIVVSKKHTRFGQERYVEGISQAVASLGQYQESAAVWIDRLRSWHLTREEADSIILQSFETDLIGTRQLPLLIDEWRKPEHDDFKDGSAWSLWNAYTAVLGKTTQATSPAKAATTTIRLQGLFKPKDVIETTCERIAV